MSPHGVRRGLHFCAASEVFKLDPKRHLTVLYSLTGGADGCGPTNLTLDSEGNLYGMSGANGFTAPNHGTVFKITMPWRPRRSYAVEQGSYARLMGNLG